MGEKVCVDGLKNASFGWSRANRKKHFPCRPATSLATTYPMDPAFG
jgi:hypothetical protein